MSEQAVTVADNTLLKNKKAITSWIPEHSFEKFRQFIINASLANADLNNASYQSITKAFMDCAKTGLMPDGAEAAIVTRYVKDLGCHVATFQPMVKGVVRIINDSPRIKSFNVKTVYEGDEFEMWADEHGDHLKFKPSFENDRTDENIKLFYACAVLENESTVIEVMTKQQVEKHKQSAKQQYVWNNWFSEMGIKTIIHRILKRLPIDNPEVSNTIKEGIENSLDIELESNTDIIDKPKYEKVFKSKDERLDYIMGLKEAINSEDKLATFELYNELTTEQQMNIWREFGSKSQLFIRKSLDEQRVIESDIGSEVSTKFSN